MRAALLLAVVALANTCAVRGGIDEVNMTTLTRGSYAASKSRNAFLAATADEYRTLWSQLIGRDEAPAADFEKGVVVFLLAGSRNTGGWTVNPQSASMEGDTAVIRADVQGPPPDAFVTQAFTYPYAVVWLDNRDIKNVRWPQ